MTLPQPPKLIVPQLVNLPPRMQPFLTSIGKYRYFYIHGGRGSGKSQSVARTLLYLAEHRRLRVVCGRELQKNIEESVYTILKDLIREYNLNYEVLSDRITHRATGSEFKFKGFREQGAVSIKGMEGVDIVWVDEAEAITKKTLRVLVPTVRKPGSFFIFTMNPNMTDDAVPEHCVGREDTLDIECNYVHNPFISQELLDEAEHCRKTNPKEYDHVWLGKPRAAHDNILFDHFQIENAFKVEIPFEYPIQQRVIGIDFAAQGDDYCVASILDRRSNTHWSLREMVKWDQPNSMVSTGRIIDILGTFKPDVAILDVGGMGSVVHDRLIEAGADIHRFDGGSKAHSPKTYGNKRAEAYYLTKDWFDRGILQLDKTDLNTQQCVKELKAIKAEWKSNGQRMIEAKLKMKKELGHSPDHADSVAMAIWAADNLLGQPALTGWGAQRAGGAQAITRAHNGSRRHGNKGAR